MQYNQAHYGHNPMNWHGHYKNHKYKNVSEHEATIKKQKEVQEQLQHRIYQLRDLVIEERQRIVNLFPHSNQQELRDMLIQFCHESFECEYKIAHRQSSIKQMQNVNNIKQESIAQYQIQKQQYIESQILLTDEKDNVAQLQQLASQIQSLDRQIKANDLFAYQSEILDQLQIHKQKLLYKKKHNLQLKEQLEIRQLQQKVAKNNFVLLLSKYQSLTAEHQQQRQTLVSLQKHREQIQSRLKVLMQEKEEIAKKSAISFALSKQIAECEQQKKRLQKQYEEQKEIQKKREEEEIKLYELSWKNKYQLEEQLQALTEQYRKMKKKEQRKEKRYQKLKQSNHQLCEKIKMLEQKISAVQNPQFQSQISSQSSEQQEESSQKQHQDQDQEEQGEEERQQKEVKEEEEPQQQSQKQNKQEDDSQQEIEQQKAREELKVEKSKGIKTSQKQGKNEQKRQSEAKEIDSLERAKKRYEEQRQQEKENKKLIMNVTIIGIIFMVLVLISTAFYS